MYSLLSKNYLLIILLFFVYGCKQSDPLLAKIDETLILAAKQYNFLIKKTPKGRYPKTYYANVDKFETSRSGWWCSGFYPGTLLYLNENKSSDYFNEEIKLVLSDLKREQFNKTTHDLGFMMYNSFGNANRLNPTLEYQEILMNSAKSLASRFNDSIGCIKSWDTNSEDFVVIIDNMMNLELLFWASKYSKDSKYYNIAVKHANTTIKNHFRKDYSSYHVVNYNKNNTVKLKRTVQGYSDESAWARGQAWGLYGFTVMYRETKDEKYLEHANGIANYVLNHPNMPVDLIPYWDYNAPYIPNELRDSSAAAILASALLELKNYVASELANKYNLAAKKIINSLITENYIAKEGTNGGFLLKHGVGHYPEKTEIDTPLSYGDYYFVEAMLRYKHNRI